MLLQLQQRQQQLQREVLLQKQRRSLYSYALSESGERIVRAPKQGPKSPLAQTEFALAKRRPGQQQQQQQRQQLQQQQEAGWDGAEAPEVQQQEQQQMERLEIGTDLSISTTAAAASEVPQQPSASSRSTTSSSNNTAAAGQSVQQSQPLPLLQQQWQQLQQESSIPGLEQAPRKLYQSGSSSSSTRSASTAGSFPGTAGSSTTDSSTTAEGSTTGSRSGSTAADDDPSRGLCLSVFLYCCSRTDLMALAWQLGLPPGALLFVDRVADADAVLHVKPGRRERHYQYDDVSDVLAAVSNMHNLYLHIFTVSRL
jgi:hypothetical protein